MSKNEAKWSKAFLNDHQQQVFPSSENSGGTKLSASTSMDGVISFSGAAIREGRESEMNALKERERRKKMKDKFYSLRDLLPQLPPQADKSTIVNMAVNYIKKLEQDLEELIKKQQERINGDKVPTAASQALLGQGLAANSPQAVSVSQLPHCFKTWSSPNVVVNIIGEVRAGVGICTSNKPGLLTNFFCVMEKYGLELVFAQVSSNCFRSMYQIHARVTGATDQFHETSAIEEIFKLAVSEMLLLISIS